MHDRLSNALRHTWLAVAMASAAQLAGCSTTARPEPSAPTAEEDQAASPLFALTYVAGASWRPGKPPREQDLAGHFAYVDELFAEGKLVVNGLYGDDIRGLYVFNVASEDEVREIVANDPGVLNGTLASDGVAPWLVMWDGLGAELPPTTSFFVLEYAPGSAWQQGKPPTEQDLGPHFAYVDAKLKEHRLLAAGPLAGTDHGRYIITAASKEDADAFVASDPGVISGVVKPVSVHPWAPVHRQTQAAARARVRGDS